MDQIRKKQEEKGMGIAYIHHDGSYLFYCPCGVSTENSLVEVSVLEQKIGCLSPVCDFGNPHWKLEKLEKYHRGIANYVENAMDDPKKRRSNKLRLPTLPPPFFILLPGAKKISERDKSAIDEKASKVAQAKTS